MLLPTNSSQCHCWVSISSKPSYITLSIPRCESEFRICADGYEFDSQFQGPNGYFALWHSACDGHITYTPTTPAITSLSTTVDQGNCLTAESYCGAFGASTDSCVSSYTLSEELQSCWCQAAILNLASRCEVDGSLSCLLQTPTTTDLWSYKHCRGSSMGVPNTAVMSSRVILNSQAPVTSSTLSPSSTASAVKATAASKSSASHLGQANWLLLASIGLVAGTNLLCSVFLG
jgi:hypothetical protein